MLITNNPNPLILLTLLTDPTNPNMNTNETWHSRVQLEIGLVLK